MTLGQKIKKLRIEKGLTQKELADKVYVTFQTVSKWEKDENEPDVSTIRQLSKLFGCSMDYLLSEDESNEEVDQEEANEVVEETPVTKTIIINHTPLHVCAKCGKDILEKDLVSEDVTKKERVGRSTRTVSVGQTYYHRECLSEIKKQRAEAAERARIAKATRAKKLSFGWGIAGGVITLGIALTIFLLNTQYVHPALGVLFSVLMGYGIFAMLYCIISGSYIGEVFLWCATLSIKFPGLIFSWSFGGFVWLIAMKILFAVLGFLVGVGALFLGIAVSSTLSIFSFPFVLLHNIRTDYGDAL